MTASTPLDTLTELAREARDQAGQILANERNNERAVAQQLESLGNYRQEYAQRLQQAMCQGIDPATMRNYQQFLSALDDALERARQALTAQQQRVTNTQKQWQNKQCKLSSYETLTARRVLQEQLAAARQEQRLSDEFVTNREVRRRLQHQDA
ncbi:flagellar export protein FliJ [Halochromatium salexigens]|uniref:Flagellar FliJ protein n=1 Tax=Halochromatium salexigens TaxID=49447 RepID=A0AAJ0XFK8_HALSE|nr:flagellar export protein FliJ [Halochromatium salexigens]MBK5929792.1 flagellar export protein FliJ [Halochromatium salexigens]